MATIKATPKMKYLQHKRNAASRGLEFTLTFDEWLAIWGDKLERRGSAPDDFQMCRTGDRGGYTPGNVRIATAAENRAEFKQNLLSKDIERDWGDSPQQGWLWTRKSMPGDYFRARIARERAIERGEVVDEEEDLM